MTGLGHREAAQQVKVDDLLDVGLVVALGAQVLDGPAEQPPLHTGLDHERQIRHRQHLDAGDGCADVTVAAVFLLESVLSRTPGRHDLQLLGNLGACDDGVRRVVGAEDLVGQFVAHTVLHVAPASVEGVANVIRSGGHYLTVARDAPPQTVMSQTQAILTSSA